MGQVGRYEIIEQMGTGAMGTVYRARDTALDREIALKTIRTGVDVAPEIRQRFYREARACARLQHPNIITVFDMGEVENTAYIAMELLEGADFRRIIQERRSIPVEAKLAACVEVCEAGGCSLEISSRDGLCQSRRSGSRPLYLESSSETKPKPARSKGRARDLRRSQMRAAAAGESQNACQSDQNLRLWAKTFEIPEAALIGNLLKHLNLSTGL